MIDVAELIVKLAALVEPNLPELTPAKLVPAMVTGGATGGLYALWIELDPAGWAYDRAGPADLRSTVRGQATEGSQ
ncbi:MAG: hypothetical protein ABSG95_15975 [Solirubrobacteraceae bacterium]